MTGARVAAVVGGLGLIGAQVGAALRADGWQVWVVDHRLVNHRGEHDDSACQGGERYGDLLEPRSLPSAVAGAQLVVQCANFPSFPVERPRLRHTYTDFDERGTAALVAAARRAGCRRYIYFSGSGVPAEEPASDQPWFVAMYRGEQAVLNSGMEAVCIRPTLVYGPCDRTLNRIVALGRRLPVIPLLGSGRRRYQPVYVGDVAELTRQAARLGGPQGVFEVGGPQRMAFAEVIATALAVAGVGRRRLLRVPPALARLPGSPLSKAAVDFAQRDDIADLTALRGAFDLRLTPLAEGLGSYLRQAG